jgi:Cu(I)/Ag(I) efflux system membrane fusion protein
MNNLLILAALALSIIVGCKGAPEADGHQDSAKSGSQKHVWHCPMHPQVVRDKAGSCPICGMDLVEFAPDNTSAKEKPQDSGPYVSAGRDVSVSASVLQKIGVRTEMVDNGQVGREVLADAEGVLDQASEVSVTVRTMGYLETVQPLREGDKVGAGQILATFYGPDLVAAQGDWLSARTAGDSLATRIAFERMASLGLSSKLVEEIGRSGKVRRAVPIVAGVSGWIRTRSAVQGQSTMAGQELFRIVAGSGALLEARLPMNAASVRPGDQAEVTGAGIGKVSAKVVSLVPQLDRSSRSVIVRLSLEKAADIRIGAQYQVSFTPYREAGMIIPENAVLHSGKRDVVFLALGDGKFRPVEVVLGPIAGGKVLVRSGLELGDEVVVSAQFLLDGESRLQSALDQLDAGDGK